MARDGRILAQRVGREWRFLLPALEAWLQGSPGSQAVSERVSAYRQLRMFEEPSPVEDSKMKSTFGDTAFTKNRREPMHRWVPWIAGFSASFVEEVFDLFITVPPREVTILDPFAGVGTTLVEGLKRGYNVAGFEINPYAALACKVKLRSLDHDGNTLTEAVKRMGAFVREKMRSPDKEPESKRPRGFKSRIPFFSPTVEKQVLLLKDFINTLEDGLLQDLFRVALGSVMVSFSNYSYEPSLSTRAAAGKNGITEADVVHIISKKLWEMIADVSFLQKHMARFDYLPRIDIHPLSFLNAADVLQPATADVLITSPPYLNNYHYIRNTRPQMYWLDLVNGPEDLHAMEKDSFGQFWQTSRSGPDIELRVVIPELHEVLEHIRDQHPEKGEYGGRGWANYASSYFNDCDRFCEVARTIMKPGGRVLVVIGNNILQGFEVKTDEFLAQIAQSHGFEISALHRVRKKRTGSSIINSSVRVGMTKKQVELYETAVELMAPR